MSVVDFLHNSYITKLRKIEIVKKWLEDIVQEFESNIEYQMNIFENIKNLVEDNEDLVLGFINPSSLLKFTMISYTETEILPINFDCKIYELPYPVKNIQNLLSQEEVKVNINTGMLKNSVLEISCKHRKKIKLELVCKIQI